MSIFVRRTATLPQENVESFSGGDVRKAATGSFRARLAVQAFYKIDNPNSCRHYREG